MQQTHGFSVPFEFPVHFTQDAWNRTNTVFFDVVRREEADRRHRVLAVIDSEVASAHSWLSPDIRRYFAAFPDALELVAPPVIVPGGEAVKNDFSHPLDMLARINDVGLDRQSFVVAIGGGAVLDMVSFAAAIAHRGVRVIRFPTTVLSQADSGIAVKNGINLFGKKNFVGTFVPPFAVINDSRFLESLSQRDRISGVVEAIKVALLRDPGFYRYLEANIGNIVTGELSVLTSLIRRSAELHLAHICGNGDPFELGSARPLDFGHWAAHKLESMTHHRLRHGEAVAIGIALDVIYSVKKGHLAPPVADRILSLLEGVGFRLWDAALTERTPSGNLAIIQGLREFREHLGGELHVTLLRGIGQGFEVTEMDDAVVASAIDELEARGADPAERVEQRIVPTAMFGRR
jgi:3-dehydroquinate synthase